MGLQRPEPLRDAGGGVASISSGRSGASAPTTSTSSTPTSGWGSSRSAPTSRIRRRCGSTGTSGPNAKPTRPGSRSPRCPTGSRPARSPSGCRRSATRFGPEHVQAFFDRWITQIPTPFTAEDRAAGYWWELSMRQVEVSPHARARRPAPRPAVLRSARRRQHRDRPPRRGLDACSPASSRTTDPARYRTRIFSPGTEVKIDFRYKHSRVKQYLKDGRALRIETVINKPADLDVLARLAAPARADRQSPRRSTTGCL